MYNPSALLIVVCLKMTGGNTNFGSFATKAHGDMVEKDLPLDAETPLPLQVEVCCSFARVDGAWVPPLLEYGLPSVTPVLRHQLTCRRQVHLHISFLPASTGLSILNGVLKSPPRLLTITDILERPSRAARLFLLPWTYYSAGVVAFGPFIRHASRADLEGYT